MIWLEHNKDFICAHNSVNSVFSSVPASGEEVHPAQEAQLGRGVRVWQWLLRQRVQLRLLGLRGLQFRVSQPRQSELTWILKCFISSGSFDGNNEDKEYLRAVKVRSHRDYLINWLNDYLSSNWLSQLTSLSLSRTRPEPRPWEPSLKSGRPRWERTEATSTWWTRTVFHWRQPPN